MKLFRLNTGKIVGANNDLAWSQTHIFFPEDKQKRALFGNLLVSFSFKAKKEEIDVASFGKEIISRFHELYYASAQEEVLIRLKAALKNLVAEFSNQVELQIAGGVVIKKESKIVGYFALSGQGKVVIFRDNQLVSLVKQVTEEIGAVSGFLHDNDWLVLATSQFFSIVSFDSLKASLTSENVDQATESLAAKVHAEKDNSQTAAVIFKVQIEKETSPVSTSTFSSVKATEDEKAKEGEMVEEEKEGRPIEAEVKKELVKEKSERQFLSNLVMVAKNLPGLTRKFVKDFRKQPSVFLRDKERKNRAKRTTLSVAFILIALLLVSVFLGNKRKTFLKESQQVQNVYEEAEYKYEQAVSMKEINPLRGRSLLSEAKDLVEKAINTLKDKNEKEKLTELLSKIEIELEKVGKEYKVESAPVFLDLGLVKEGFKGRDWGFWEGKLQILDQEKATILEVGVVDKATRVAAGGEKIAGAKQIGVSEGRIFVVTATKLVVVDQKKGEAIYESEGKEWGRIVDLNGFGANAYLLDGGKGKILKYPATDKGVGSATNYLKVESLDFEDAVSMAIDGSVWLLFSDGSIVKFTRGVKEPFLVSGADTNFDSPEKIYTDPDLENLYVLDRKNTRVVVINKDTGEYKAQYFWPGMAGAYDLFASEEEAKILLLTGERIYEIPLKD
ncbi:MAG TPA: hypothetical protein VMW29_01350 [Candidatus Bathyarchaeia archaeon]|nr:hypothetical protein [Candidatus Bathyarchaeia archaeon]